MNVLMVTDSLGNGGAERQLALLAASLPEPWSASVLTLADGPYRSTMEELGIDVRVVPRRFRLDVAPAYRMWRLASHQEPDIVHTWGWMSSAALLPFCRMRRLPLVNGMIRRGYLPTRHVLAQKLGLKLADAIVANSRAGLAVYGVEESDRTWVIYNGFDHSRLQPPPGARIDRNPSEDFTVIMAARMTEAKDWPSFLDAARSLAERDTGWRFLAVGSGPQRESLMHQAADLVRRGFFEFHDSGTEATPLMAAADVGVLLTASPTYAEGCSNSILEYMACGLPVVCTDSGGNPEVMQHGVTGLLVRPGDPAALAAALETLRSDPVQRAAMGARGCERVRTVFSVEAMVTDYVRLYASLLDAHLGLGTGR